MKITVITFCKIRTADVEEIDLAVFDPLILQTDGIPDIVNRIFALFKSEVGFGRKIKICFLGKFLFDL
jgi:hypothetical protein